MPDNQLVVGDDVLQQQSRKTGIVYCLVNAQFTMLKQSKKHVKNGVD
jgi:hypothetical protein